MDVSGKTRGGAIFVAGKSGFSITNAFFLFNHVEMDGGGIYLFDCKDVVLHNNVFLLNKAKWGGAIYLERCSRVSLVNNLFVGNRVIRDGGAVSLSYCSDIRLLHNHYWANHSKRSGNNIDFHHSVNINNEDLTFL